MDWALALVFLLPMFLGMVAVAVRLRGWIRTAAILLSHFIPLVGLIAVIGCLFVPPENPEKPWALDRAGRYWLFGIIFYFAVVTTLGMFLGMSLSMNTSEKDRTLCTVWAISAFVVVLVSGFLIARSEPPER
ncbi:MAG: hypothetical protein QM758_04395 [Armatimonas sp.]